MCTDFSGDEMQRSLSEKTLGFILAGGQGTRLRPYTLTLPKPMLTLNEQPILEILLLQMKYHGIDNVVVSLGYLGDIVKAYCQFLSTKSNFPSNIHFVEEDKPLGTCGPLSGLSEEIVAEIDQVIVINGDIISDICFTSLLEKHCSNQSFLTVAIRKSLTKLPLGVVEIDEQERVINFKEKPEFEALDNLGIYVYSKEALKKIPKNTFYGADKMILDNLDENIISYLQQGEYMWIDVGTHSEFDRVQSQFDTIKSKLNFLESDK